VKYWLLSPI
jgi:hypothetical protein